MIWAMALGIVLSRLLTFYFVTWSVCLVTCASILMTFFRPAGLCGNPSVNGLLIAVGVPIALYRLRDRAYPFVTIHTLALVAIFLTRASIPVGTLAVVLSAFSFSVADKSFNRLFTLVPAAFILVIGYLLTPEFFNSSGRFEGWAMITKWWWASDQIWFGLGNGMGARVFGQRYLIDPHFGLASWAHNDYLQIAFDFGITGLAALLSIVGYTLYKSFHRPWLFASNAGYAACMFFSMPLYLPLTAFLGASLLVLTHASDA